MRLLLLFLFLFCVQWEVTTHYMIGCSEPEPTIDEFGRGDVPSTVITLQACWDSTTQSHQRCFESKIEAEAFIARGRQEVKEESTIVGLGSQNLSGFRLLENP